jgi:hypothetical protein
VPAVTMKHDTSRILMLLNSVWPIDLSTRSRTVPCEIPRWRFTFSIF